MKKNTAIILVFLLCISMSFTFASSKGVSASVIETKGEVNVKKSNKTMKAFEKMKLSESDGISTAANSTVKLLLEKKIAIMLAEKTSVEIKELKELGGGQVNTIKLSSGSVLSSIDKKLDVNNSYIIQTPTMIMGARGTDYIVTVDGSQIRVQVLSGVVSISEIGNAGDEVKVEAGYQITIDSENAQRDLKLPPVELKTDEIDPAFYNRILESASNSDNANLNKVADEISELIEANDLDNTDSEFFRNLQGMGYSRQSDAFYAIVSEFAKSLNIQRDVSGFAPEDITEKHNFEGLKNSKYDTVAKKQTSEDFTDFNFDNANQTVNIIVEDIKREEEAQKVVASNVSYSDRVSDTGHNDNVSGTGQSLPNSSPIRNFTYKINDEIWEAVFEIPAFMPVGTYNINITNVTPGVVQASYCIISRDNSSVTSIDINSSTAVFSSITLSAGTYTLQLNDGSTEQNQPPQYQLLEQ